MTAAMLAKGLAHLLPRAATFSSPASRQHIFFYNEIHDFITCSGYGHAVKEYVAHPIETLFRFH